jgi:hypothetical protein
MPRFPQLGLEDTGHAAGRHRASKGGRSRGFFVAFGYSHDAEAECAAFHDSTELVEVKRTGRIIKLLTVRE